MKFKETKAIYPLFQIKKEIGIGPERSQIDLIDKKVNPVFKDVQFTIQTPLAISSFSDAA